MNIPKFPHCILEEPQSKELSHWKGYIGSINFLYGLQHENSIRSIELFLLKSKILFIGGNQPGVLELVTQKGRFNFQHVQNVHLGCKSLYEIWIHNRMESIEPKILKEVKERFDTLSCQRVRSKKSSSWCCSLGSFLESWCDKNISNGFVELVHVFFSWG